MNRTWRTFPAALLAAAALFAGGCMKTDDVVKVQKDGSGSYVEDVAVDSAAAARLEERWEKFHAAIPGLPGGAPGGEAPPPAMEGDKPAEPAKPVDPLKRLEERLKAIEGLEVTKFERGEKDGKGTLHLEANFKTLEAYAKATFISTAGELKKNEDGSWTLSFGSAFGRRNAGRPGAGEPGMGDPGMGEGGPRGGPGGGIAGMLAFLGPDGEKDLEGLAVTRKVTLPGEIVSTNGTKADGDATTVTWTLDLKTLKESKDQAQTVTFKGEGLDLKPFQLRRRMLGGDDAGHGGHPGGPPGGPGGGPGGPPPGGEVPPPPK